MKSYKDLPQEGVLNSPDGAMWVRELILYYKYENDEMWCYAKGKWSLCTDHDLCVWSNECNLIPLPNVKIPWETTEDSGCPVPGHFEIFVWLDGNESPLPHTRDAQNVRWYKLDRNNISAYRIIDQDYMRKEPESNGIKSHAPDIALIIPNENNGSDHGNLQLDADELELADREFQKFKGAIGKANERFTSSQFGPAPKFAGVQRSTLQTVKMRAR